MPAGRAGGWWVFLGADARQPEAGGRDATRAFWSVARDARDVEGARGARRRRVAAFDPRAPPPNPALDTPPSREKRPLSALALGSECTHLRIVPLPPMRTEPASFLSFSTSILSTCGSGFARGDGVSVRAVGGEAVVGVRRARRCRGKRCIASDAVFLRQGFGGPTRTCDDLCRQRGRASLLIGRL